MLIFGKKLFWAKFSLSIERIIHEVSATFLTQERYLHLFLVCSQSYFSGTSFSSCKKVFVSVRVLWSLLFQVTWPLLAKANSCTNIK